MFSDDSEEDLKKTEERKNCEKVHGELSQVKEKKDGQSERQSMSDVGHT